MRRASSCAAATASCDFSVSLLKSMSPFRWYKSGRRGPRNEVAAVMPVHGVDRLSHLALHAVEAPAHPHELVLQPQHVLDTGEIEPELVRQPLDQLQPLEIRVGVQPRVAGRPLRPDQSFALVD